MILRKKENNFFLVSKKEINFQPNSLFYCTDRVDSSDVRWVGREADPACWAGAVQPAALAAVPLVMLRHMLPGFEIARGGRGEVQRFLFNSTKASVAVPFSFCFFNNFFTVFRATSKQNHTTKHMSRIRYPPRARLPRGQGMRIVGGQLAAPPSSGRRRRSAPPAAAGRGAKQEYVCRVCVEAVF